MKRTATLFVFLMMVIGTAMAQRVIKNPEVDYTPSWFHIDEIRLDKDATVVKGEMQNLPNWWCRVDSTDFLIDPATNKKYMLRRAEGVEIGKLIYMPESGNVPCTLFFEPVGANVNKLNFLEIGNRAESNLYGIHLTSSKKTKKVKLRKGEIDPRTMTAEYYQNLPANKKPWTMGLHKNMDFVERPTMIRGHLVHYIPELGMTSVSLILHENMTRQEKNLYTNIGKDGTFEFSFPLSYAHTAHLIHNAPIYIESGDTLDIYIDMEVTPYRKPRYMAYRSNGESAMISLLWESLEKKLNVKFDYKKMEASVAGGSDSVMVYRGELLERLRQVCNKDYMDKIFEDSPLSPYGKEVIAASARANIMVQLTELYSGYNAKQYITERDSTGKMIYRADSTFVPLDAQKFYAGLESVADLLFDCPLMLSTFSDWVFFNRLEFTPLFENYWRATDVENLMSCDDYNQKHYGFGRCFMSQVRMSRLLSGFMQELQKREDPDVDKFGNKSPMNINLHSLTFQLADILTTITYPEISHRLMTLYRETIRKTEGSTKNEDALSPEHRALLDKIIKPYRGNLLYMDFWNMGCGPCRQGMLQQREMAKDLKEQPVRFLYVYDGNNSTRTDAEKWMGENQIPGEHIYISHDEWMLFQHIFNFTAIPHGVLIDQKGKVLQEDIYLMNKEQLTKYIK